MKKKRGPFVRPFLWAPCMGMGAFVGVVLGWNIWVTDDQFGIVRFAVGAVWVGFLGFVDGLLLGSLAWLLRAGGGRESWGLGVASFAVARGHGGVGSTCLVGAAFEG